MTKYLGAHTINNGGIHMAVKRAGNAGMTAMQLFTAIPKYYGDKVSIKPERVERFKAALAETKIKPENVVVHAAYVLSVATPDDDKWIRAAGGLAKEMANNLTEKGLDFAPIGITVGLLLVYLGVSTWIFSKKEF